MSFIESLLMRKFQVKSQYDFGHIATNQCSWCACEFVKMSHHLLTSFLFGKEKTFQQIYEECLLNGSNNREKNNSCLSGENIDDLRIKKIYANNFTIINFNKTEININQKQDFLDLLDDNLKNQFFIRDSTTDVDFETMKTVIRSH